jgi:hypothetical protein
MSLMLWLERRRQNQRLPKRSEMTIEEMPRRGQRHPHGVVDQTPMSHPCCLEVLSPP